MGAFEYTAVDQSGKQHQGIIEGDTPRHVRQLLREKDLLPLTLTEAAAKESIRQRSSLLTRGLSSKDLAVLTRQLSTLVQSGMPLEESLSAVAQQTENTRLQSIIMGVRAKVREGFSFAEGLSEFPSAFPMIYCATVEAGEQSGHLDAVLERLADFTEKRQELFQKVRNAMIYPALLVSFCIMIVTLMMAYVVPKVVGVFTSTGQDLPTPTALLIGMSNFFQSYGWFMLICFIGGLFTLISLLKKQNFKIRMDLILLKIPLIRKIILGLNTARFTRTFSIMTGSGVPVLDGLKISAQVITNLPMRNAVNNASLRISEGAPIGSSLNVSGYFPPLCIHLINSGEASGQLEKMLDKAAEHQEREMDGLISTLLNILEPAMIILMGIMVLGIVVALLLPIFEMNKLVL
ncbi:MAG: type II secretion system inner membrane protein GspF [Pseudomonadota bacterium]|nr:type II secretion system inner membrane protein GspF [Pseudomonadota bacterium]